MLIKTGEYSTFTDAMLVHFNTDYYSGENLTPEFMEFIDKKLKSILSELKGLGHSQTYPNMGNLEHLLSRIGKVRFVIFFEAFLGMMPDIPSIDKTIPAFQELSKGKTTGDFLCLVFIRYIRASQKDKDEKINKFLTYMKNCHNATSDSLNREVTYKTHVDSVVSGSNDLHNVSYAVCLMLDKKDEEITDHNKFAIMQFMTTMYQIFLDVNRGYDNVDSTPSQICSREGFAEFMKSDTIH